MKLRCIDPEHQHQKALMQWVELAQQQHPELALLFAIPNGGARSKATAGRLKAEGVKSGVPDLFLPVPRDGAHGLFIEMKAPDQGRVEPIQETWHTALRQLGYAVTVAFGWTEARDAIEAYLRDPRPMMFSRDGVTAPRHDPEGHGVIVVDGPP